MKSIFDPTTKQEIIARINTLNENSKAQWGTMNVYQMAKHCTQWEEMLASNKPGKQVFIGKLIGKWLLKKVMQDDKPFRRNSPTIPELKVNDEGNIEAQKAEWIASIEKNSNFSNPDFVHPFFGKMTREQVGYLAYKHMDHHLRQFNA